MMGKTHKTAVVIIPPEQTWEPIQTIRREMDKNYRRWMPHITLIYPFKPRDQFDELSHEFRRVCRQMSPFELELSQFNYFSHSRHSHTLWLDPCPGDRIMDLQANLQKIAPDCDDVSLHDTGFTPHLSVGQVRPLGSLERVRRSLQEKWIPLRFDVKSVSLIWRDDPPDDVFRTGREVSLGDEDAEGGR